MPTPKQIHEKLPYEVISHTFSFLEPTFPLDAGITPFSPEGRGEDASRKAVQLYEPPITLSLVCKSWRCIVLDSPRLWTFVHIQVKKKPITKETIDAAKTWFERSKKLGCHLFLEFPLYVGKSSDQAVVGNMVWNLVQPIASRLETLVLCIPAASLSSLQNLSPFRLPRLQTLAIRFPRDDSSRLGSLSNLPKDAFAHCTSLRNLELAHPSGLGVLQYVDLPYDPTQPSPNLTMFSYASLRSLKLVDPRMRAYMMIDILHLATNLHYCELKVSAPHIGITSANATGSRSHPNLQVLKICFTRGHISHFLAALDTMFGSLNADLPATLLDFMVRHPLTLKRLEIRGLSGVCAQDANADTLLDFLRMNEGIETLALDGLQASRDYFVEKLTWRGGGSGQSQQHTSQLDGRILPRLKNLSLADTRFQDIHHGLLDEVLFEFLHSRWDGLGDATGELEDGDPEKASPARLRKVILPEHWGILLRSETFGELIKLKSEGLVLPVPRFEDDPPESGGDWVI
ncbi:hypothetical protein BDN72DRAFT_848403 [Pluteus cervinus]|uniref:Uncharacterized protein n=1 Tax=Pluteus cervinus TaxID=181527 RepID=A0ACD3AB68_9AGAR|nr:hypothetical protein BDN72DRAFT_848403 [Pluteus cervinus]